ncbi:MAG: polysaccharide biosynthesis protein [Clostridia bacterium]|nr:polysaccharide biosynthesis protein [Clostridia bacterium]
MRKKDKKKLRPIGDWNRGFLVLADVFAVAGALLFAYLATQSTRELTPQAWMWMGGNLVCAIVVFAAFGLYSIVLKNVGVAEMVKILMASVVITAGNIVFPLVAGRQFVGLGTGLVYAMALAAFVVFIRYFQRLFVAFKYHFETSKVEKTRVMIVGGGDAGSALIKEMQTSDKLFYKPVCIADDDPEKVRKYISDVKVAGTTFDVKRLSEDYKVQEIFIAMPSVDKKHLSEVVKRCQECGCPVKVLPGMYQLASGQVTVATLRPVEVQDLLGREQVSVNLDEIMSYIEKKVVLVTGGGGSIGSELCRQIATHNPETLIILDVYENNAYDIEQELKRRHPDLHLLTLIASVREMTKMRDVFQKYRPQIVFHAAAHKHVPLMETSPNEAVKNNVFGTLNVARCADEFGVETFVQISTDKAVNPTNIMGATKRICEMIVQTIGKHSKKTKFVAVRFGNVLGSNGSVIPLFRRQIAEGGPVTVTHEDIIRYFMTIPEAVSLVLQAGAYAKGGQIFVLDMGEPVRIYDLAYNLIRLSGYEPNVDIDIVCTGLRPGEKLFEERLMEEEGLQKTPNGLINIAKPIKLDEKKLWSTLDKLYEQAYGEADDMKKSVKELVPTYTIDKRDSIAEALCLKKDEQKIKKLMKKVK